MRLATLAIILLAGAAVTHAQSGPTFRQLAIEHKGQAAANVGKGCGWAGPPLTGIVRFSDIAVEGVVLSKRTYATPDDRDILTEYELSTRQVIFERLVPTTAKPGLPPPTIFKTRGGTVVFDGYSFTLSGDRRTQLNVGDHIILFGRNAQSDGKPFFADRDVFHVSQGMVLNWLPTFDEFSEGLEPRMPLAAFAQKVRDLAR